MSFANDSVASLAVNSGSAVPAVGAPPAPELRAHLAAPEIAKNACGLIPRAVAFTVRDVDVYEFRGGGEQPHEFEIAFPVLGDGVSYRVRPIQH